MSFEIKTEETIIKLETEAVLFFVGDEYQIINLKITTNKGNSFIIPYEQAMKLKIDDKIYINIRGKNCKKKNNMKVKREV